MTAAITIQYKEYVMDEVDAYEVFKALSRAQILEYDYSDNKKHHYFTPVEVSMRLVSEEDLAMATIYTAARENK